MNAVTWDGMLALISEKGPMLVRDIVREGNYDPIDVSILTRLMWKAKALERVSIPQSNCRQGIVYAIANPNRKTC